MSEQEPDVSELRQWTLLRQLHQCAEQQKLGPFLKANGYPHDSTQKPWGKYYAHIRNKNIRVTAMPADGRLLFIDGQIAVASSMPQVKEKRTVVDYLFALSLEDKRKLLGALRGLDDEEQDELLSIIIRSKNLVNEGC
jgi:hypothetical protein